MMQIALISEEVHVGHVINPLINLQCVSQSSIPDVQRPNWHVAVSQLQEPGFDPCPYRFSTRFSGFIPPPKNLPVDKLAKMDCP